MSSPVNGDESEPSTSTSTSTSSSSVQWSQQCRQFDLPEILLATHDFDESLVIGHGGFGKVYKGNLFNGSTTPVDAAIKRLDSMSNQGAPEFWAEVEMLSKLRHCHLVSLIGYCNHENEMILVYEYLPLGTLSDHLHTLGTSISWIQRLKISIGAARGLDYLHTGTGIEFGIIHRDVKTSNILLHESGTAQISDFGLSRIGPKNQPKTHVSTLVKGTFGYFDPNYFHTGNLTRKSDVYAFGVVLLEILCRKRAVDESLDEEQWGLATWAQESIKEGKLKQIVDYGIKGEISPKCLKDFVGIAQRCMEFNPKHRPTMAEVVFSLESVLSLQEKTNGSLQTAGKTIFGMEFAFPNFMKKKKLKQRKQFFEENGGLLLEEVRANAGIFVDFIKVFGFEELKEATQNFAEHRIIGGGNGTVFKGTLVDKRDVAIKKIYPSFQMDQFINEIVIAGQIKHRNMVRLLGCCLETQVPLLVNEFVSNGTLYDHIHNGTSVVLILSWESRLRIAHETAGALAFLHAITGISKIHGHVRSTKIFLDEQYTTKIEYFGSSLYQYDDDNMTTLVQGTWGYLDTEFLMTCKLTDKSEVYSFGVVLAELLTRKKAFDMEANEEDRYLATYFVKAKRENRWREILDPKVVEEATDEQLEGICELVCRCLDFEGVNRPSMKEVTMELETIMKLAKHPLVN